MTIRFNPSMDVQQVAGMFQAEKRCRIQNVFDNDIARTLASELKERTNFTNAYMSQGQNKLINHQTLASQSPTERQQFFKQLYADASKGVGFFYGRQKIEAQAQADDAVNLPAVLQWLNSETTLEKMRQITGIPTLSGASAQATRYTPGHFLTRHNDVFPEEKRRVAYVLGFTEQWHPDWGGLLQFYQQDGTPREAWAPGFNSMTLFAVEHVHAVTFVAPYAAAPRLSITGWFTE